ncbi:MAG: glycosyltransferase [Sphaerochaeta sp.]|nr:glycosyltransferase [Sphaerochaeta sp.]
MRILITTDFYLPNLGGVTTVVLNERSTLTKLGHEVRLLTIGPERTSFFEDGVYHLRASALKLFPDSYMTFSYHDPLLADILAWKPEVVHSNNEFFTMGYAQRIAKKLGDRLVHTCHTDFTRYNDQMRIRHHLWDQLMARVIKRRVRNSHLIISPSEAHRSMLCRYGITKPMAVLPSGIDLERFSQSPEPERLAQLRSSLGLASSDFVLISVSRLAAEKRLNLTIDAFFLLSLLHKEARLLIVGGGPKEASLKKQVCDLGMENQVIFTGIVAPDQIPLYYHIADLFVSSSIRESQGLGFIEAMATSMPVLLQEDGSLGFSIEEEGCGYLYGEARQFVILADNLISDRLLLENMGTRARKASERFSLMRWAQSLSFHLAGKTPLEVGNKADD